MTQFPLYDLFTGARGACREFPLGLESGIQPGSVKIIDTFAPAAAPTYSRGGLKPFNVLMNLALKGV